MTMSPAVILLGTFLLAACLVPIGRGRAQRNAEVELRQWALDSGLHLEKAKTLFWSKGAWGWPLLRPFEKGTVYVDVEISSREASSLGTVRILRTVPTWDKNRIQVRWYPGQWWPQ